MPTDSRKLPDTVAYRLRRRLRYIYNARHNALRNGLSGPRNDEIKVQNQTVKPKYEIRE